MIIKCKPLSQIICLTFRKETFVLVVHFNIGFLKGTGEGEGGEGGSDSRQYHMLPVQDIKQ